MDGDVDDDVDDDVDAAQDVTRSVRRCAVRKRQAGRRVDSVVSTRRVRRAGGDRGSEEAKATMVSGWRRGFRSGCSGVLLFGEDGRIDPSLRQQAQRRKQRRCQAPRILFRVSPRSHTVHRIFGSKDRVFFVVSYCT